LIFCAYKLTYIQKHIQTHSLNMFTNYTQNINPNIYIDPCGDSAIATDWPPSLIKPIIYYKCLQYKRLSYTICTYIGYICHTKITSDKPTFNIFVLSTLTHVSSKYDEKLNLYSSTLSISTVFRSYTSVGT